MKHTYIITLIHTFSAIVLLFCIKIYSQSPDNQTTEYAAEKQEEVPSNTLELGFPEAKERKETRSQKKKREEKEKYKKEENSIKPIK